MDESLKRLLDKVAPDRRSFVQRILGMAGFAAPAVRTFVMGSAVASVTPDVYAFVNATTTSPTTPAPTTTTPAPRWRPTPAPMSVGAAIDRKPGGLLPHPGQLGPGRKGK
jgi:hypothetical protein